MHGIAGSICAEMWLWPALRKQWTFNPAMPGKNPPGGGTSEYGRSLDKGEILQLRVSGSLVCFCVFPAEPLVLHACFRFVRACVIPLLVASFGSCCFVSCWRAL